MQSTSTRAPLRRSLWTKAVGRAQGVFHRTVQAIPCALIRHHNRKHASDYDLRRTIIISAVQRGGSTWLGEVLGGLNDTTLLWEPLDPSHPTKKFHLRFFGLDYSAPEPQIWWRPYIPDNADWPEARAFFHRLLTGQFVNPSPLIKTLRPTKHYLLKFVRANRLLPWLTANFELRPPVFLVRHPCAVVASQLRHIGWAKCKPPYVVTPSRHSDEFHEPYREFLATLRTFEEAFAAQWCLDQLVPLQHPDNDRKWVTIAYEQLVRDGTSAFANLYARLGLAAPPNLEEIVERPSRTAKTGSPILNGGDQLSGWRKQLSSAQIKQILAVVKRFGLADLYSDALEPNYSKLVAPVAKAA